MYLYHPTLLTEGGTSGRERFRIGDGSATTGSFYSFGSTAAPTDRALGIINDSISSASPDDITFGPSNKSYFGFRLTNNTGVTLTEFTLQYVGEQWRKATGNNLVDKLTVSYKLDASGIEDSDYTDVTALDFSSPIITGNGRAIDGNAAENRAAINPYTVSLTWAPGQDLWIRWTDNNNNRTDHSLAVDDVKFSAVAVPEANALLLVSASAVVWWVLTAMRRR